MREGLFRKSLVFIIVIFLLIAGGVSSAGIRVKKDVLQDDYKPSETYTSQNIIYVDDDAPPGGDGSQNHPFQHIQDGIDVANAQDTVYVYSGTYYENIVVDKSISLIGEDNDTTVIDAQKDGTPIRVIVDSCLVSGFTILNCEEQINQNWRDAVIKIDERNDVLIKDNILNAGEVQTGPYICYGSIDLNGCTNCNIINNYIVQNTPNTNTIGIALHDNSSNNIISENDVSHYDLGVVVAHDGINYDNIISENHIHHNRFGVAIGNGYNEILNNIIEYNPEVGINIQSGHNNIISFNIVQYNGEGDKFYCGIELMGYTGNDNNIVSDNVIAYNNPCGLQTEYSHGNVITRNNFIDNYGEDGTPERWWGNAYVHIQDGFFNKDKFRENYWSDSFGIFPKIIHGILELIPHVITINWINIDWRPAKEPYDIGS